MFAADPSELTRALRIAARGQDVPLLRRVLTREFEAETASPGDREANAVSLCRVLSVG